LATSFKDHAFAILEVHEEVVCARVRKYAFLVDMLSFGSEAGMPRHAEGNTRASPEVRTSIRPAKPEDVKLRPLIRLQIEVLQ